MIDINYAIRQFKDFVSAYDLNDSKIKLKLEHTYHVIDTSKYLCQQEGLSDEQTNLACLIALLHDIGRFKQLELYHSFDDNNIDHGILGIKILFEDNLIRKFITDNSYDQIIYDSILNHSLYKIKDNINKDSLLQVKLIRDSDKLDNFRVKNSASIETLFDITQQEFITQQVSDNIMNDIISHRLILKDDRHNEVDMWVSYFAFIFDLNFQASYCWLSEKNYITSNIERFNYQGLLKEQMDQIKIECNNYVEMHK